MPERPIRVFLVDDHAILREGLRSALGHFPVVVVGEAATIADAREGLLRMRPDVAIVDLRLPDGSGIELIREIRSRIPSVHCLVFTSYSDGATFFRAFMAGASGYVSKSVEPATLYDAVRRTAAGESMMKKEQLETLRARRPTSPQSESLLVGLTDREKDIVRMITEGRTNREIAESLSLAEKTVRNHVTSILEIFGLRNRTELAALLLRLAGSRDVPG